MPPGGFVLPLSLGERAARKRPVPELTSWLSVKLNCGLWLRFSSEVKDTSSMNNHDRAVRYRRLALSEPDEARAALLQKIANEAERGVLCTVDRKLPLPEITSTKPLNAS